LTFLTQKNRQNEETEKFIPNEQDKATTRDLGKTVISNMPNREFKAMIIRILTRLEKRVEDMSEAIKTGITINIVEMKSTINEMRNT